MKICKYCGTTNEEDFIRKNGKIGKTVCTTCNCKNKSGENNPFFGKKHILKIKLKVCKYCGTTNEEDFIRSTGNYGVNVCTKCFYKNISGDKNHNWKEDVITQSRKCNQIGTCKQCGTTNEEDFIKKNGNGSWNTICTNCLIINMSKYKKGRKCSEESKQKMSEIRKGMAHSDETKQKMSKASKRENLSDETIRRMSNSQKGRIFSCEHRKNLSESLRFRFSSEESKNKLSESHKYTIEDYREKYPLFCKIEEIREAPHEIGKSGIQVRCKKCGEWFTPMASPLFRRINQIENDTDGCYLYCSDECKNSCSIFGLNVNHFMNNLNKSDNEIDQFGYYTWRNEVLNRQLQETGLCYNHCEICNSEVDLHVHHELPQKTHPLQALDPDNGIVLCTTCHIKHGHQGECSTGALANIICTPKYNENQNQTIL